MPDVIEHPRATWLKRAFEEIARAEIKLLLVLLTSVCFTIPFVLFGALQTDKAEVDIDVYACDAALPDALRAWIAQQDRAGLGVTATPTPDAAAVAAGHASYRLRYVASGWVLQRLMLNPYPEPFAKHCRLSGYGPTRGPVPLRGVDALWPSLPSYAAVGVLVGLSLRARKESLVPASTPLQAIRSIPVWCWPLGITTMCIAGAVVWIAHQFALDIGTVRQLGPLAELLDRHPLLAAAAIVLAAPLFEELSFRRWLLEGFLRADLPVLGSIIVSANFALPHLSRYEASAAFALAFTLFFTVSLVLCRVYVRTRNVFGCIGVHLTYNAGALLIGRLF